MNMSSKRINSNLTLNSVLERYNNLLHIVYLESKPCEDGSYKISSKTFEKIQTELDFNPPKEEDSRSKRKREDSIKKRYRQRKSYRFWKELLDNSNCKNYVDAENLLMSVYKKLDNTRYYGSMTHSKYALETLFLAIDDLFGTNKTILETHSWVKNRFPKPKKVKKPPAKKSKKLKKKAQEIASEAEVPF